MYVYIYIYIYIHTYDKTITAIAGAKKTTRRKTDPRGPPGRRLISAQNQLSLVTNENVSRNKPLLILIATSTYTNSDDPPTNLSLSLYIYIYIYIRVSLYISILARDIHYILMATSKQR